MCVGREGGRGGGGTTQCHVVSNVIIIFTILIMYTVAIFKLMIQFDSVCKDNYSVMQ